MEGSLEEKKEIVHIYRKVNRNAYDFSLVKGERPYMCSEIQYVPKWERSGQRSRELASLFIKKSHVVVVQS